MGRKILYAIGIYCTLFVVTLYFTDKTEEVAEREGVTWHEAKEIRVIEANMIAFSLTALFYYINRKSKKEEIKYRAKKIKAFIIGGWENEPPYPFLKLLPPFAWLILFYIAVLVLVFKVLPYLYSLI